MVQLAGKQWSRRSSNVLDFAIPAINEQDGLPRFRLIFRSKRKPIYSWIESWLVNFNIKYNKHWDHRTKEIEVNNAKDIYDVLKICGFKTSTQKKIDYMRQYLETDGLIRKKNILSK